MREVDQLRAEVRTELTELRDRLTDQIAAVDAELAAVRGTIAARATAADLIAEYERRGEPAAPSQRRRLRLVHSARP